MARSNQVRLNQIQPLEQRMLSLAAGGRLALRFRCASAAAAFGGVCVVPLRGTLSSQLTFCDARGLVACVACAGGAGGCACLVGDGCCCKIELNQIDRMNQISDRTAISFICC